MLRRGLACCTALLGFAGATVVIGQSPDLPKTAAASKPLIWDVISVKPNHSLDTSSFMRWNAAGIDFHNMTLHGVLLNAFEVRSESQITG